MAKPIRSPEQTFNAELTSLRIDYLAARADALKATTRNDSRAAGDAIYNSRTLARSVAIKLGHGAAQQGSAFECWRCGASGSASDNLVGKIFVDKCGVSRG